MRPKAIFFDVGGTLLLPDMSRLAAPLYDRGLIPTDEQIFVADKEAKHLHLAEGDDAPGLHQHWFVFFSRLVKEMRVNGDLLDLLYPRAAHSMYWSIVAPQVEKTLDRLKGKYRLAVISNADGKIRNALDAAGLTRYFESITDSGIVGHAKPDARIFQAALDELQLPADECVYVGDVYGVDYLGALGAGMQAVVVDYTGVYRGAEFPRFDTMPEVADWIEQLRH